MAFCSHANRKGNVCELSKGHGGDYHEWPGGQQRWAFNGECRDPDPSGPGWTCSLAPGHGGPHQAWSDHVISLAPNAKAHSTWPQKGAKAATKEACGATPPPDARCAYKGCSNPARTQHNASGYNCQERGDHALHRATYDVHLFEWPNAAFAAGASDVDELDLLAADVTYEERLRLPSWADLNAAERRRIRGEDEAAEG